MRHIIIFQWAHNSYPLENYSVYTSLRIADMRTELQSTALIFCERVHSLLSLLTHVPV